MTDERPDGVTLSTAQAAEQLGVTVSEVLRRIARGEILAQRQGDATSGPWKIPTVSFAAYLAGRVAEPPDMVREVGDAQYGCEWFEAHAENARRDRDELLTDWHARGIGPSALAAALGERGAKREHVSRTVAAVARRRRTRPPWPD